MAGVANDKKKYNASKRPNLETKEELIRYLETHPETEPPFYQYL